MTAQRAAGAVQAAVLRKMVRDGLPVRSAHHALNDAQQGDDLQRINRMLDETPIRRREGDSPEIIPSTDPRHYDPKEYEPRDAGLRGLVIAFVVIALFVIAPTVIEHARAADAAVVGAQP